MKQVVLQWFKDVGYARAHVACRAAGDCSRSNAVMHLLLRETIDFPD
jgi:hypothetical protein